MNVISLFDIGFEHCLPCFENSFIMQSERSLAIKSSAVGGELVFKPILYSPLFPISLRSAMDSAKPRLVHFNIAIPMPSNLYSLQ